MGSLSSCCSAEPAENKETIVKEQQAAGASPETKSVHAATADDRRESQPSTTKPSAAPPINVVSDVS